MLRPDQRDTYDGPVPPGPGHQPPHLDPGWWTLVILLTLALTAVVVWLVTA